MATLLVFAGAATCLAVLSVDGVPSQRVRERTREIGIRMAMGASAAGLVGWVARVGVRLIGVGLAAGLLAAWLASNALEGLLFGVPPTDALTVAAVVAAVGVVGVVATLVPSWRATRIDPVAVLRRG
jgi:putative ABC transport system permease protein